MMLLDHLPLHLDRATLSLPLPIDLASPLPLTLDLAALSLLPILLLRSPPSPLPLPLSPQSSITLGVISPPLCCSLSAVAPSCCHKATGEIVVANYKGVTYTVTNEVSNESVGGKRFHDYIGLDLCLTTMKHATDKTWEILNQTNQAERRPIKMINLIIFKVSNTPRPIREGEIHITETFFEDLSENCIVTEFTGFLYESVSLWWQWYGNNTPDFLINGIAGFIRFEAGYPSIYWKQTGDITEAGVAVYFLWYCTNVWDKKMLVARLNKELKDVTYCDKIWIHLVGASPDILWKGYNGYIRKINEVKH